MKKATVTYTAPKGDSKMVEMLGHTFYDGQSQEVVCEDANMTRLQGNRYFKVSGVSDYDPEQDAPKPPHDDKHKGKAA
ncbi:hypothetical protein [Bradyrhizobium arachidis]|uniref:Uncharacterized protein n=1 Tax=Bradyrhizobium arachidis TaxID=858423 RepID=A0AAE7NUA6_9BRAD|nr:hypothetical protein [Bradyrhizobium arachidis]QOZ68884.1 hypothetical protein WN72_23065 [Bradyrhizobium arachidis]SFV19427.1 hypothetical protein SAMN05192541_1518 [Bradyrhizobium arachidis]